MPTRMLCACVQKVQTKDQYGNALIQRGCWLSTSTPSTCSNGDYSDGNMSGSLNCCTNLNNCNGADRLSTRTGTALSAVLVGLLASTVLLRNGDLSFGMS